MERALRFKIRGAKGDKVGEVKEEAVHLFFPTKGLTGAKVLTGDKCVLIFAAGERAVIIESETKEELEVLKRVKRLVSQTEEASVVEYGES